MRNHLKRIKRELTEGAREPEANDALRSYQREVRRVMQRYHILVATCARCPHSPTNTAR